MDIIVTVDPANIHYILSSNFSNYTKGADFKEVFDVFGEMIFNSDTDLWKNHRRAAQYMLNHLGFQKLSMSATRTKLDEGLVPLFDHFSEDMVVDLQNVYSYIKPNFLWKLQNRIGFGQEKTMIEVDATFDRVSAKDISAKRKELDTTKYELLNLSDDKFLRDTILAFNLAGRETMVSALSWFFWLLFENPQVVTKIRQEIINKYHPSGHKVDANSTIMIFLYALGRMRAVWGEYALEFKPERWHSQSGWLRHEPSFKFLSFNAGPRTCPGKQLAMTLLKIVAVEILQKYDINVIKRKKIEPNPCLISYMNYGLGVTITKRCSAEVDV